MNRFLLRRHFLAGLGVLGVPFGLPSPSRSATAASYTMRLSVANPPTAANTVIATRFASAVNRRSNGQLSIEVYPNGQLANEAAAIDALTTGTIDFTIDTSTTLVPLLPQMQVWDLPFLFKDVATAFRVLDGPVGKSFFARMEPKGLTGLGWGSSGFNQLEMTTKAVVVPEDLRGQRIRVVGGGINTDTFQALGAIPVSIEINEVYTALSQHTIDGIAIPLSSFAARKLYTIVKSVAMANHVFQVQVFLGSKRKIDVLPAQLQKILRDEAAALSPAWRSLVAQETSNTVQLLKDNGVSFTEIQFPAFRRAVDPVYVTARSKVGGDLLDQIGKAVAGR